MPRQHDRGDEHQDGLEGEPDERHPVLAALGQDLLAVTEHRINVCICHAAECGTSAPLRPVDFGGASRLPSRACGPDSYTRGSRGRKEPHDRRDHRARHPAVRSAPRPARHQRAAVGHPQVLRRPRDDARCHQPGRRRAGLHDAAPDHRGGRPVAAVGSDPLHQQLRDHRAAPRAVAQPGAAVRRRATTRTARSWSPSAPRRRWPSRSRPSSTRATRSSSTSPRTWPTSRASPSRAACRCSCPRPRRTAGRSTRRKLEAAITPRTKALFLGYPCNPTGAVLDPAQLRAIADIAQRHDLIVISDEIYDRLVYGDHRTRRSARCRACRSGPSCWAASPRHTP